MPGQNSRPVPEYAARISVIAQRRSRMWSLLEQLWLGDPELIRHIRSGEFGAELREFFQEIGQESLAHGALMSLDVYARGARRREESDDIDAFLRDHAELLGTEPYLADIQGMKELCREESAAWAAGELGLGRDCRRREFVIVEGELEAGLVSLGRHMMANASTHVWRTLARLMLVFLATETGHQQELQN